MQRAGHVFVMIAVAGALVACGGEAKDPAPGAPATQGEPAAQDSSAPQSPATTERAPALDACAVLRSMDLTAHLGAPAETYKESVRTSAGTAAATMCSASPAGGSPTLSLMLRYRKSDAAPADIEAWIRKEFAADSAQLGAAAMADLHNAEVVPGLGDFAVVFTLSGPRASVYWKSQFLATASSTGFADKVRAQEATVAVARMAVTTF